MKVTSSLTDFNFFFIKPEIKVTSSTIFSKSKTSFSFKVLPSVLLPPLLPFLLQIHPRGVFLKSRFNRKFLLSMADFNASSKSALSSFIKHQTVCMTCLCISSRLIRLFHLRRCKVRWNWKQHSQRTNRTFPVVDGVELVHRRVHSFKDSCTWSVNSTHGLTSA